MKHLLFIVVAIPAFLLAISAWGELVVSTQAGQVSQASGSAAQSISAADLANARQARALLNQAIQALGGQAYLNVQDMQEQGRAYSFDHGVPAGAGVFFWRFLEYPDKERIELTKERDVAEVYNGNQGYEVTYRGPRAIDKKALDDYLRRRKFSLDAMLRTWINDPRVALFYDGEALAGNLAAQQIRLINEKDEAVSLFLDVNTHLPIKKSYSWRDPVDRQRNVEEEIYDNYRPVQGIMTPYGFTRYYNGDMQTERFVNSVQYNQELDPAMFDPNSGYAPSKTEGKHKR
ncbi:MAG: hypothetical protein WAM69_19205 [Candidatus Sulfotelmatobacter sp.]